ncbi:MAG: LysM peptidoglycan-binding domain-containing protein [Planctomycetota bacterium]
MQQIERYGVIALLLVLVTVLGVSMWSSGEEGPESTKRLAAETQKQGPTAKASPAKSPARVGPMRRTAPKQTENRGVASNLGAGRASKGRDIAPIRTQPSGPANAVKSKLGSSNPVAGVPKSDVSKVSPAASGLSARERARRNRERNRELAEKSTNNRERAGAKRVVANPTQQPGAKLVRDPSATTNVPGQPYAGVQSPKNRSAKQSTASVTKLVRPSTPKASNTAPGSAREYTVRSGDTLSAIASRELGSAKLWPQIERANPKLNPKRLLVGTKILLPNLDRTHSPVAVAALESGATTYTVQAGDVLGKISQRMLGTAKRWTEIRDLNPTVNPDRLHVGTVLVLPAASAPRTAPVRAVASSEPRVAASTPRRGKKGVVR